jgi:glyoxylase-like metal-dependent hydrolase (beta-lactamase superfamily II)
MDGRTQSLVRHGELACHCLLLETSAGLVLVDTGFGSRDVHDPQPRDVRHIVLTHLDFDHAGGRDDFPGAVHLLASERDMPSGRDARLGCRSINAWEKDRAQRPLANQRSLRELVRTEERT